MKKQAREIAARALWLYAWWKDGEQYVGTTGKTLKDAQKDILAGKDDALIGISDLSEE